MTRLSRDDWALGVAAITARRGTCLRRQVGCVLLDKDGFILSTGYNGRAAGLLHCSIEGYAEEPYYETAASTVPRRFDKSHPNACAGAHLPSGEGLDSCEAIHAEANALLRCRDVREIHTCYVTVSPCVACTKLLLNTGCRRIVFIERYAEEHYRAALALWMGAMAPHDNRRSWEHLPGCSPAGGY